MVCPLHPSSPVPTWGTPPQGFSVGRPPFVFFVRPSLRRTTFRGRKSSINRGLPRLPVPGVWKRIGRSCVPVYGAVSTGRDSSSWERARTSLPGTVGNGFVDRRETSRRRHRRTRRPRLTSDPGGPSSIVNGSRVHQLVRNTTSPGQKARPVGGGVQRQ